ncbi:MAG: SDR family NAD(P)-dependent oxidoreductase [Candidatus Nanopelagicales bacterium]
MTTVLITGSTDGIGLRTAQTLRARGCDIIVHGRNAEKVDRTRAQVGAVAGLVADLGDLRQVQRLADQAAELHPDVLINNAGIYARERVQAPSGEATWVVNHLAASLLADMLIPTMTSGGRVVYVSSIAHGRGEIDLDDPEFRHRPYDHYAAYAQSKLANLLMAQETARRLGPGAAVSVNALHPGVVGTKLLTEGFQVDGRDDLDQGCATSVYLAVDAPADITGQYFVRSKPAAVQGRARDTALAAGLYDLTMETLEERT